MSVRYSQREILIFTVEELVDSGGDYVLRVHKILDSKFMTGSAPCHHGTAHFP